MTTYNTLKREAINNQVAEIAYNLRAATNALHFAIVDKNRDARAKLRGIIHECYEMLDAVYENNALMFDNDYEQFMYRVLKPAMQCADVLAGNAVVQDENGNFIENRDCVVMKVFA